MTVSIDYIEKKGKAYWQIYFSFNPEFLERVRKLPGRIYQRQNKTWLVPKQRISLESVMERFEGYEISISEKAARAKTSFVPQAHLEHYKAFAAYLGWKNYSRNTQNIYLHMLRKFLRFYPDLDIMDMSVADVDAYLREEFHRDKASWTSQRQMTSTLKLFFKYSQSQNLEPQQLEYAKSERALPKVFSKEEMAKIIGSQTNIKHKALLSLQYGCGLRVSELLALRLEDVSFARSTLTIKRAKGFKDRRLPLSDALKKLIAAYYRLYKPKYYLFEGQGGGQYSAGSVNKILQKTCERLGINRRVYSHMLRHSYATHLLESGTDLRYVQELLGHNSSRTTEIYTFVSTKALLSIKSPFDDLDLSSL